jgi:hypothetical protein
MTARRHEGTDLDDLLKGALADDLPADVAAGMRDRIRRFRAGKMKDEKRTAARAWFFRRSAWAVLSILMLVSGILLQGRRARNPLADRISLMKTEFASVESTRRPGLAPEPRLPAPDKSPLKRRNTHDRDS